MKKINIIEGEGIEIIVLVIIYALFSPPFMIWAINTLLGTAIPQTIQTWIAVLVLLILVRLSILFRL
jgi:hypothetical protein